MKDQKKNKHNTNMHAGTRERKRESEREICIRPPCRLMCACTMRVCTTYKNALKFIFTIYITVRRQGNW